MNLKPGAQIHFGNYPQEAEGQDKSPILWRILAVSDKALLLLSEEILDCKRYHGKTKDIKWKDCVDVTWRDCDLRHWLNHDFYDAAFSSEEKKHIQTTLCKDNGESCQDTEDKVFLLSVAEVKALIGDEYRAKRRATATPYAKAKKSDGCNLYVYDKTNRDNYVERDGEQLGCSWWWLRTQGNKPSRACFIGTGDTIRSYANVSSPRDGVRPAIRINL